VSQSVGFELTVSVNRLAIEILELFTDININTAEAEALPLISC